MPYEIKNEKDLADAFTHVEKAQGEFDSRLTEWSGTVKELAEIVKETQTQLADAARRQTGPRTEAWRANMPGKVTWEAILKAPTRVASKGRPFEFEVADSGDLIARFQDASDQLYMLAGYMKMIDANGRVNFDAMRSLTFYRETYAPLRAALVEAIGKDAFHTTATPTAGSGTEWDPTEFSSRLWEKARLPLAVEGTIQQFNMPRSPFLFPVELADLTPYRVAEVHTAGTGTAIADGKGATVISSSKTFTGVKIATLAFTSKEAEEDSIVAILPYLEFKVAQALANGRENAIINGDTAATHMDNDTTGGGTDVRTSFNGLRDYAINTASSGTKDASGNYINSDANWRDYVRGARKLMGDAYKANNARIACLVSGNTAIDIGSCEAFRTAYAIGSVATNQNPNITGFRPDGLGAFVVSEFHRSTVAPSGVNTAGGPNTYTTILQYHMDAWLLGVVRTLRLEVLRERYADLDQDAVKVTWRGDLQSMLAGNHTVATIGVPGS